MAINDRGQIVGETSERFQKQRAFLWQDGKAITLGSLNGGDTYANDINVSGQVVGNSTMGSGWFHGFLWENGKMIDLGTLGGRASEANGVNDVGWVVGSAATADEATDAFLWKDGVMQDLGSPGSGTCSARRVNGKGVIVGYWWPRETLYKGSRALVWIDRNMYDLNDLIPKDSGWVLEYGSDVNDKGEIVGSGKHNGQDRAFLLKPYSLEESKGGAKPHVNK
jgi:probable HAF family extracellular repeat protein